MARRPILSDEEVLRRARAVFVEWGYGARTKQISAAVGLTWGAIALRFGDKRQLFRRAMAGPLLEPGEPRCDHAAGADLRGLLEGLRSHLWERWPQRLQYRLAMKTADRDGEPDGLQDWLAAALERARGGVVRSDLSARELAQAVLMFLVGDVARRFMAREQTLTQDPVFIDSLVVLLSGS